ncbi:hypothetical protein [Alicyclobacillus kakegawensis]|uniref:hypothetical protein n=1 Tax=Alicyclobacillus kakegawensis TaxID=392012 RepID=UPI000830CCCE|nr:hypothetical protein [Alicyclobacillus kakegawensis]
MTTPLGHVPVSNAAGQSVRRAGQAELWELVGQVHAIILGLKSDQRIYEGLLESQTWGAEAQTRLFLKDIERYQAQLGAVKEKLSAYLSGETKV